MSDTPFFIILLASGMPWEYYVTLAVFAVLVVPWSFFNFQQTKYLQMCTLFLRNFALLWYRLLSASVDMTAHIDILSFSMIILSITRMSRNDDEPNNTIKQDIVMFRYELSVVESFIFFQRCC